LFLIKLERTEYIFVSMVPAETITVQLVANIVWNRSRSK